MSPSGDETEGGEEEEWGGFEMGWVGPGEYLWWLWWRRAVDKEKKRRRERRERDNIVAIRMKRNFLDLKFEWVENKLGGGLGFIGFLGGMTMTLENSSSIIICQTQELTGYVDLTAVLHDYCKHSPLFFSDGSEMGQKESRRLEM